MQQGEAHDGEHDAGKGFEGVLADEGDKEDAEEGGKERMAAVAVEDDGSCKEEKDEQEPRQPEGKQEVEVLVVGVQVGVGKRGVDLLQPAVTLVNHIACPDPEERMFKE